MAVEPLDAELLNTLKGKEAPVLIDGYPDVARSITFVDAQTALVIGNYGRVAVLDISDPQNVQILSRLDPKVSGLGEGAPERRRLPRGSSRAKGAPERRVLPGVKVVHRYQ